MTFKQDPLWKLIRKLEELDCTVCLMPITPTTTKARISFKHDRMIYAVWACDPNEFEALIKAASYLPPTIKTEL